MKPECSDIKGKRFSSNYSKKKKNADEEFIDWRFLMVMKFCDQWDPNIAAAIENV